MMNARKGSRTNVYNITEKQRIKTRKNERKLLSSLPLFAFMAWPIFNLLGQKRQVLNTTHFTSTAENERI
jgi:hypothetical protein